MSYQALPKYLHIQDSPVSGQGIFASQDIPENLLLGMSHIVVDEEIIRTPLGGFINPVSYTHLTLPTILIV